MCFLALSPLILIHDSFRCCILVHFVFVRRLCCMDVKTEGHLVYANVSICASALGQRGMCHGIRQLQLR